MRFPLWSEPAPYVREDDLEGLPQLTPYVCGQGEMTSAVLVCPGGGYGMRAEHEGEPVARWLNGLGITAFVLDYRVAPYRHPVPLGDAQRAIRYIRHHADQWNVDPNRIGILGFSAGGHLAMLAGTEFDAGLPHAEDPVERESCRPDLMILCYPVISFVEDFHAGSVSNLLGAEPPEEARAALSGERRVTSETPPAFLWHTSDDGAVPVENSLRMGLALRKQGIPFELHSFESGRHGLGLASDQPESYAWTELCGRWLRRRGF